MYCLFACLFACLLACLFACLFVFGLHGDVCVCFLVGGFSCLVVVSLVFFKHIVEQGFNGFALFGEIWNPTIYICLCPESAQLSQNKRVMTLSTMAFPMICFSVVR